MRSERSVKLKSRSSSVTVSFVLCGCDGGFLLISVIDENEIVYRHFVDLSVAVATPKGLVVPVLRNVEAMDYAQIEFSLNELGVKVPASFSPVDI